MKQKRLDYEILRILAIFGVVFNHTQKRGFELFFQPGCSRVNYAASLLLAIACKIAVPLFFLVSGGLLLHRDEPIKTVLKKRVFRMFVVLVVFSGITYLCWSHWGSIEQPGFRDFVTRLWSNGISAPYWYLYTYLGLMVMLPLLRPMVQGMRDRMFLYLTGLHILVYGILGTAAFLLNMGTMDQDLWLPLVEPNLFYFLMGYYLAHRFSWERIQKKQLWILWGLAAAAVAVMFALVTLDFGRNGSITMNFHKSLIVFPVFAVYATVHQLCAWHTAPEKLARFLTGVGSCVFGAYLLEGIGRRELDFLYVALEPKIHVIPACLVWVIAVVVCGLAVTWVLKKIPGVKKFL